MLLKIMTIITTLLSLFISLLSLNAAQEDDVYAKCLKKEKNNLSRSYYDKENKILCLKGAIDDSAIYAFEDNFEKLPIVKVLLNSGGGTLRGGQLIAELIRERNIVTEVQNKAKCMSNCMLVFSAGLSRRAGLNSTLGIHYVYQVSNYLRKIKKIRINLDLTKDYLLGIDQYSSSLISTHYYEWARKKVLMPRSETITLLSMKILRREVFGHPLLKSSMILVLSLT